LKHTGVYVCSYYWQVVRNKQLRSEFEVKVGLATVALGLPVSVTGQIVTTADILSTTVTVDNVEEWTLSINSVRVEDSNVPLLRAALDSWLQVLYLLSLPLSLGFLAPGRLDLVP
jgi:hypothetical protein